MRSLKKFATFLPKSNSGCYYSTAKIKSQKNKREKNEEYLTTFSEKVDAKLKGITLPDELDIELARDFDLETFNYRTEKQSWREVRIDDAKANEEEKFIKIEEARYDANAEDDYPTFGNFKFWDQIRKDAVVFDYIEPFQELVVPVATKVDLEQLMTSKIQKGSWILVDVRSLKRAQDYKIPSSVNIPIGDIGNGCFEMPDKEFYGRYGCFKPNPEMNIIFASDSPDESEMAALLSQAQGYVSVFNYRGGVQEWFGAEFKEVYRVHPRVQRDIENILGSRGEEEEEMDTVDALNEEDVIIVDENDLDWEDGYQFDGDQAEEEKVDLEIPEALEEEKLGVVEDEKDK